MNIAILYNRDLSGVINIFGMQNREKYNPKTVRKVADALEMGGHNVQLIDGNMYVIDNLAQYLPKIEDGEKPVMVFNMAYGIQGESRYTHIPSLLEMLGIPYVGSSPSGHALALDKVITKILMQKSGLPTPDFWVFSNPEEDMSGVVFPVIVKPKMESVSMGLKIVHDMDSLKEAVDELIKEYKQEALVEQFIPGREFCVGLLGNREIEAFPVLEIDLGSDPNSIQTLDDKLHKPFSKICPAMIPEDLSEKMKSYSIKAFRALGLRDMARVDIRVDERGNIYLLEINSMPSLGVTGSFLSAANAAGYSYEKLMNRVIEVALARYFPQIYDNNYDEKRSSISVRSRVLLRERQANNENCIKKLVNTNSFVRNVDGVNHVGDMISQRLKYLGFTKRVFHHSEIGNDLFFANTEDKDLDFILFGHIDVSVPFKEQVPYKETEHKIYGTGVWTNKGGLAVILSSLSILKTMRKLKGLKIGVFLSCDDTIYGKVSQKSIMSLGLRPRYVLGFSGSKAGGSVVISRSGASLYKLEMKLSGFESTMDVAKYNTVFLNLLSQIVGLTDEREGVAIAIRSMDLRSSLSSLHCQGEALVSVRFDNIAQAKLLDEKIKKMIRRRSSEKYHFGVEGGIRRNPLLSSPVSEEAFKKVKSIANELGLRSYAEHRWSSSNIFAFENACILDGLGPIGEVPQNDDEYILRQSIIDRALLTTMILLDF